MEIKNDFDNLKNENADISVCRPYLFEVEERIPKEDLEKIPMLKREDMKREAAPLYNKIKK
jgi:hypothetical protein